MKSLLTPAIWIAAVAILLHTGMIAPSAAIITFALHAALVVGLLMAWRFHSSRIFFALLVVFLAERAISYYSSFLTSFSLTLWEADRQTRRWWRWVCSCR